MKPTRRLSALRIAAIAVGVALILWAVRLWSAHEPNNAAVVLGIYGAILVAALLLERWRYSPNIDRSASGWQATDEKFIDPVTGNPVQVWFNPRTGERDYRPL